MIRQINVTGSDEMNYIFNPSSNGQLEEVLLHLSATGGTSENFQIQLDSKSGSEYDVVEFTQDMNTESDVVQQWTKPRNFVNGDKFNFTYTNTNDRVWGLTINFRTF